MFYSSREFTCSMNDSNWRIHDSALKFTVGRSIWREPEWLTFKRNLVFFSQCFGTQITPVELLCNICLIGAPTNCTSSYLPKKTLLEKSSSNLLVRFHGSLALTVPAPAEPSTLRLRRRVRHGRRCRSTAGATEAAAELRRNGGVDWSGQGRLGGVKRLGDNSARFGCWVGLLCFFFVFFEDLVVRGNCWNLWI